MIEHARPISRRNFIGGAAASLSLFGSQASSGQLPTLRSAAADKRLLYGTAVRSGALASDTAYADLVGRQAGILVCEGETKRNVLQPSPTGYNFLAADAVWKLAKKNDQKMRGHTFIWHRSIPPWLASALQDKPSEKLITDYISTVAKHFRGRFHSWDVVNEVVNPDDGEVNGMRSSSAWYRAFGEQYIDLAFHSAKEADPEAILFLNEANTEPDVRWGAAIRQSTLDLIDRLQKRNVPIEGVGIQAHLKLFRVKYSDEVFSKFLDEIISRGLKVLITEFDVADIGGTKDPEIRDAEVASLTRRFLDVAFSKPDTMGCLTWGITNKYSWLNEDDTYRWPDGQLSRSLPFDGTYRPNTMYDAMMTAYSRRI
jgi:endo-1,4-beta-xylanase